MQIIPEVCAEKVMESLSSEWDLSTRRIKAAAEGNSLWPHGQSSY